MVPKSPHYLLTQIVAIIIPWPCLMCEFLPFRLTVFLSLIKSGTSGIYGPFQDVRLIHYFWYFWEQSFRYPVCIHRSLMHASWIQVGNGPSLVRLRYH